MAGGKTVKEIYKRDLKARLGLVDLAGVTMLGLDEFAIQKGHRYATVVIEPARKRVLWMGRGRSREGLRPFFVLLGPAGCARLRAVVMDMSTAYREEVTAQAPQAKVVYDLFHVVAKYGREVSGSDFSANQHTAIPALLKLLDVRGCIVTIDAMGCQRDVAAQIRRQRGHYVLAVKANQGALLEDFQDYFETDAPNGYRGLKAAYHEETDSGHGRIEVRRCWQSADLRWMPATRAWAGAKSVARVESERHVGGRVMREVRNYLSSLNLDPARLMDAVRSHWAIENRLH